MTGLTARALPPAELTPALKILSSEHEHTKCSLCKRARTRFVTQFSFVQSCWLVPLLSVIRTTVAIAWDCFDRNKSPLGGALKIFEFAAGNEEKVSIKVRKSHHQG